MVARITPTYHQDPLEDPLWQRIDAFDLDGLDPTFSFCQRLASENNWANDYAARVVEEYKRFCYVATQAGHDVIPPDRVDQVWPLHLSYSRNYWDIFCAEVLCAELHHGPLGYTDSEDADHKRETYTATIVAYERLSGEHPPSDIWPIAELLFADIGYMRRVHTKHHLIVPRPPKGLMWVAQIATILTTLYFILQGDLVLATVAGVAAVLIAIIRDGTDNEWTTKPWRYGDDDGTGSGGGSIRGI
jgi:hypothetical protein